MKKSKKERAKEVCIEQGLLSRGYEDVKRELITDHEGRIAREPLYSRIRLNLMLKWERPQIR